MAVLASTRVYPWQAGVTAGVRGGIPTGQTMFCNVKTSIPGYGGALAVGNGIADDGPAISAAYSLCPSGQYVYVPAGTYLGSTFGDSNKSGVVLRGAGPGVTTLKVNSSVIPLSTGSLDYPVPGRPVSGGSPLSAMVSVTAGATQASSTITVVDPSGFTVGYFGRLDATTCPYVWPLSGYRSGGGYAMSFLFLVTGKSGSQITFTPPLPLDISTFTPKAIGYGASGAYPRSGCGLEDLTLDLSAAPNTLNASLSWENVYDCWIKNIEITGAPRKQVLWNHAMFCEVRHSTWHNYSGAGGAQSEGFDLLGDCVGCLVEDNIAVNGGFPAIVLGDSFGGCWGNVVAYNFCRDAKTSASNTFGADIGFSHGAHNCFNLAEGNIAAGFLVDGYYGSSSHNTIHRNWLHGRHATATEGIRCVDFTHYNAYNNAVGNVTGDSTWLGAGTPYNDAPLTYNYDNFISNGAKALWRIGFPYLGNTLFDTTYNIAATTPPNYLSEPGTDIAQFIFGLDANVLATAIRHGNFNYGYSSGPEWDAGISDHVIPKSYYYTERPSWWSRRLEWPPIDPASPPGALTSVTSALIPAGYRYIYGADPDVSSANSNFRTYPYRAR